MNDNFKQLSDLLNKLVGEAKNYDPRTEEGYRNIINALSEIRKDANNGLWRLYGIISDRPVTELLDDLYKKATEIHKEANKVISDKLVNVKETVTDTVNDIKERVSEKIDEHVYDLVDTYLDELIGDKEVTIQEYKRAKQSLVDYTNWLLDRDEEDED